MPNTSYLRWGNSFKYKSVLYKLFEYSLYCIMQRTNVYIILFISQDDYLDCYGDPAVTGKIGTDIQDNKCSWLVVTALEVMTPEQRAELEVGIVLF